MKFWLKSNFQLMYNICSYDNCSSDKRTNLKRSPNPNPNPNLNPYPTPNKIPIINPHSNSFLSEISWQEQLSAEQMSDHPFNVVITTNMTENEMWRA